MTHQTDPVILVWTRRTIIEQIKMIRSDSFIRNILIGQPCPHSERVSSNFRETSTSPSSIEISERVSYDTSYMSRPYIELIPNGNGIPRERFAIERANPGAGIRRTVVYVIVRYGLNSIQRCL